MPLKTGVANIANQAEAEDHAEASAASLRRQIICKALLVTWALRLRHFAVDICDLARTQARTRHASPEDPMAFAHPCRSTVPGLRATSLRGGTASLRVPTAPVHPRPRHRCMPVRPVLARRAGRCHSSRRSMPFFRGGRDMPSTLYPIYRTRHILHTPFSNSMCATPITYQQICSRVVRGTDAAHWILESEIKRAARYYEPSSTA